MGLWIEPTDSDEENGRGKPQYPYNSSETTESGHYMEWDDTPDNERVRFQHRIGSFQEYQATGNVVHKIVGTGYTIIIKDQNVQVQGSCHVTIFGDAEMEVRGNMYGRVLKKANINVTEDCEVTVKGKTTVTSAGDINVNTSGDLFLTPTGATYVNSDLTVRGTIYGQQSISAFGNLTAGGHLGVQGSVNIVGGMTQSGGPPLPHIVTGIALTSTMAGATIITSGGASTLTSGGATAIVAGGTASVMAPIITLN